MGWVVVVRVGVLKVLCALSGSADLAWTAAKHGGVIYILQILLPGKGDSLPPYCLPFPPPYLPPVMLTSAIWPATCHADVSTIGMSLIMLTLATRTAFCDADISN